MRFATSIGWLALIAFVAVAVCFWPGQQLKPYQCETVGNLIHLTQPNKREIYVKKSSVVSFVRWDKYPEYFNRPVVEVMVGTKTFRLDAVDAADAERLEQFFVDTLRD